MMGGTQIGGDGYDKAFGYWRWMPCRIFYIIGYFSKAITIGNTNLTSIDADDSFIAKLKGFNFQCTFKTINSNMIFFLKNIGTHHVVFIT